MYQMIEVKDMNIEEAVALWNQMFGCNFVLAGV